MAIKQSTANGRVSPLQHAVQAADHGSASETPLSEITGATPIRTIEDTKQQVHDARCIIAVLEDFHSRSESFEPEPELGWGQFLILQHADKMLKSAEESLALEVRHG